MAKKRVIAAVFAALALMACGEAFQASTEVGGGQHAPVTTPTTGGSAGGNVGGAGGGSTVGGHGQGGLGGSTTATGNGGHGGSGGGSTTSQGGGNVGGGGSGTGGSPPVCANNAEKSCGGVCVDKSNPLYGCGPSGCVPCAMHVNAATICQAGACAMGSCNGSYLNCDQNAANGCETDPNTDPKHCGACDIECGVNNAVAICVAGACGMGQCYAGYANCDGKIDNGCEAKLDTDPANCGACGDACLPTETCKAGICELNPCANGLADCDGKPANGCEVTLKSNTANCGFCGNVCALPNVSTNACENGKCVIESDACAVNYADCDGKPANGCEVNTNNALAHCGACGNVCPQPANAKAMCLGGACDYTCTGAFVDCDKQAANGCEIDTSTDVSNCGSCGNACTFPNAGAVCTAGVCTMTTCDATHLDCDGKSANGCEVLFATDPLNCGSCGKACLQTETCVGGICELNPCVPGNADCDKQPANGCEVKLNTDASNCGVCGNVCALPNVSVNTCSSGVCAISACANGYADCDKNAANGCEVKLGTDTANCGGCGNACAQPANTAATCVAMVCGFTCTGNFANCDGDPKNGCEMDLSSSPSNCGKCGSICPQPANTTATCTAQVCGTVCNGAYANCDGDPKNGCEIDTATDIKDCGKCGNVCSFPNAVPMCKAGQCGIGSCVPGFADCDGIAANGCEVNLNDLANCGKCGNVCPQPANSTATCKAQVCGFTCIAPYADCDGQAANGCESNLSSDGNNCGSCGKACSFANANSVCTNSTCAMTTCKGLYGNCDGQAATGCEADLSNDIANCGACNKAGDGYQACVNGTLRYACSNDPANATPDQLFPLTGTAACWMWFDRPASLKLRTALHPASGSPFTQPYLDNVELNASKTVFASLDSYASGAKVGILLWEAGPLFPCGFAGTGMKLPGTLIVVKDQTLLLSITNAVFGKNTVSGAFATDGSYNVVDIKMP